MSLPLSALVDETTILPGGTLSFGLTGQRITGARVVLEWVVRSWFQPRGRNRLAPNSTVDVRELENATLGERELERWRVSLLASAKAGGIGYVAGIDVTVALDGRTVRITAVVVLSDGSRHQLAVSVAGAAAVVKFGGVA
jgi:hypothetical protein